MFKNIASIINLANLISLLATALAIVAILIVKDMALLATFLITVCFVLDVLDGAIARKLNLTTNFGKVFDSINDFIIYIIFPLVFFLFFLNQISIELIVIEIIFVFSGVFRLLRQTHLNFEIEKINYYTGLPVCFNLLLIPVLYLTGPKLIVLFYLSIFTVSILMISNIKFPKPKIIA